MTAGLTPANTVDEVRARLERLDRLPAIERATALELADRILRGGGTNLVPPPGGRR